MDLVVERAAACRATEFLKVLANEHRLMILCALVAGEKSVGDLQTELTMRQPHLSQQLSRLRLGGLVETRREAQVIFYRLANDAVGELIPILHRHFCQAKPKRTRRAA